MDGIEKFEALEQLINEEFINKAATGRGCFGTLLYNADDDICQECALFTDCDAAHAKNRLGQQEAVEEQIQAESNATLVGQELADLEAFRKAEEARKEIERRLEIEKKTADEEMRRAKEEAAAKEAAKSEVKAWEAANGRTETPNIQIKSRVAPNADWTGIVRELLAQKPTLYRDAALIIKAALPEVWETTRYGFLNKILKGLADKGVIAWVDKARTIEWLK